MGCLKDCQAFYKSWNTTLCHRKCQRIIFVPKTTKQGYFYISLGLILEILPIYSASQVNFDFNTPRMVYLLVFAIVCIYVFILPGIRPFFPDKKMLCLESLNTILATREFENQSSLERKLQKDGSQIYHANRQNHVTNAGFDNNSIASQQNYVNINNLPLPQEKSFSSNKKYNAPKPPMLPPLPSTHSQNPAVMVTPSTVITSQTQINKLPTSSNDEDSNSSKFQTIGNIQLNIDNHSSFAEDPQTEMRHRESMARLEHHSSTHPVNLQPNSPNFNPDQRRSSDVKSECTIPNLPAPESRRQSVLSHTSDRSRKSFQH